MSAVAPRRFAILAAALAAAALPNAQAVSVLSRSDRGLALRTAGPIEVVEAPRALLALREIVDHATSFSAAVEAMPRVSNCASHLDTLIGRLDRHYTDVQLQTVLVNFCRTSEEFANVPGFEDGFRNLKECEIFAKRLVEARDAELAGEEGSDSGYTGLCKAYINSNGRVNLPPRKPRKVKVAAERAEPKPEVVKEEEEEEEGPVMKPGYGSHWWLVAWGLLLALNLAALLICCAGACATRSPKQQPPGMSSQDMLRSIDSDERGQWGDIAETFFDTFDLDKNGFLEKAECKKALEQVAKCVADKYRRRWGSSVPPAHVAEIQNRIKWDFDLDFDGKISKQEFMKNIKKVLDELD